MRFPKLFAARGAVATLAVATLAVPFVGARQFTPSGEQESPKRVSSHMLMPAEPLEAPQLRDDVASALASLRRRGSVRYVRFSHKTGRATAVFGDLGELAGGGTRAKAATAALGSDATEFVAGIAPLVGAETPDRDLALEREIQTPLGTHVRLAQRVGDYEVFGARTTVHADRAGRVFGVTSTLEPGLDPSLAFTHPAIDDHAARLAAMARVGVTEARLRADDVAAPELGIAPVGVGRLAWRVIVPVAEPYNQWEVTIDALTGEPIGEPISMVLGVGSAKVFVPNAVVSTGDISLRDSNNAAGAVPESAYTTVELKGLDTSGFVTGPYCTTDRTSNRATAANGDFTALRRNDRGFNEVQAYWAIDTAQRYIQNSLGIQNAANYQIRVNVHAFSDDNSNYSPSGNGTGVLNFGDGGVDDAQDAEIVWHEYGHAILDNQAGIRLFGESGAIHEGWGDYVAATMSTTVAGDSRFYPTIGEWDATSYNPGNPPYLRRVDGNKQYPRDTDGEVHDDGEIWSACLWAINRSLGRAVADPIIFNANFLFSTSVGFEEAAAAVVEADVQLNGGANLTAIRQAFSSHGIQLEVTAPAVTSVSVKKSKKLIVNGSDFETNLAVIEVDGAAFGSMKYPKPFRRKGVSSRIVSKDADVGTLQPGTTYQITVFNPRSGARSAPFSFTP